MELDFFTRMLDCENKWRTYDVELLSGKKVCINLNPALICHVEEIPYNKYHLTWRFPFVRRERRVKTRFVQLRGTESYYDDEYMTVVLNCSQAAFMDLLGVKRKWTESMMKTDVKYGKHN
jgi:hypothetical protein